MNLQPRYLVALAALFSGSASAQGQQIDNRELGAGYAHLLSVVAQPEISVSGIDIDSGTGNGVDTSLDGLHIPYYHEFDVAGSDMRWYLQASAGYALYTNESKLELRPDIGTDIDSEWTTYSALLEAGLVFPLSSGFSLLTGASVGWARLKNEASFSNPLIGDIIRPLFDGIFYNWDTDAALYRAHGALRYDEQHGEFRVKGVAHLTYSYVDSFGESRDFTGFADDSGAAIFLANVSRNIHRLENDTPVYMIGHLGSTHFLGKNRDELGFDHYHEVGLSLGVSQYAAGVLMLWGQDVDGLSLVFNYNY